MADFNDLKSSHIVKTTEVMRVKRYYMGLYKAYLVKLYDEGYSKEINVLCLEDFKKVYSERGINLRFKSGIIPVNYLTMYIENVIRGGDDKFFDLATSMFYYRNQQSRVDQFYNDFSFHKTKRHKSVNYAVDYAQKGLTSKNHYGLYTLSLFDIIKPSTHYVHEYSIHTVASFGLSKLLGKPISDIELIKGVSLQDIEVVSNELINSDIILDGADGVYLTNLLEEKNIPNLYKYLQEIYKEQYKDYLLEEINKYYPTLEEQPKSIIGINDTHILVSYKKNENYEMKVPIGLFSIDYDTGESLSMLNNLYGITGDLVKIDSPLFTKDGYNYTGSPIEAYDDKGTLGRYVDTEQVSFLGEGSLVNDLGVLYEFHEDSDFLSLSYKNPETFYYSSYFSSEKGYTIQYLQSNLTEDELDKYRNSAYEKYTKGDG